MENEIKEKIIIIRQLLNENKFEESIKELNDYKRISEKEGFPSLIKEIDSLLLHAKTHFEEERVKKIKKVVLDLSIKFTRLQISDIAEKCGITDKQLIINTVKDIIASKEIFTEYFSSSKSVAFDQQANIDEIDKLMDAYKELEGKKFKKE